MVTSALKRWRIRRLYNGQEFARARQLSEHELGGKNHAFALDIIVRSLYNQGHWQALLDVAERHPEMDHGAYIRKAQRRLNQAREEEEGIPEPDEKKPWNVSDLLSNWSQEGSRLWLRHPWGWTHWDMPEGYALEDTHPALLHLALEVLLGPWVPETKRWDVEQRSPGANHSLSYSGGVDSTAAMLLLPDDTILAYHERNFTSMLNHSLPHSTFEAIEERTGRQVLCIPSNHEKIRTYSGKPTGFSTDHASGVHLIIMADFLNLNGISFGTPVDNTWLKKGLKFRNFAESDYWIYWSKRFHDAGIYYNLPINHITEGGALEICRQSEFSDIVNSCLRGNGNKWCGQCWKCFHKNGPLGRSVDPYSKEIASFLDKKPLRSGVHALWAVQIQQLHEIAPRLKPYLNMDLSWWTRAYPLGISLLDPSVKPHVINRTEHYLEWMSGPYMIEDVYLDI